MTVHCAHCVQIIEIPQFLIAVTVLMQWKRLLFQMIIIIIIIIVIVIAFTYTYMYFYTTIDCMYYVYIGAHLDFHWIHMRFVNFQQSHFMPKLIDVCDTVLTMHIPPHSHIHRSNAKFKLYIQNSSLNKLNVSERLSEKMRGERRKLEQSTWLFQLWMIWWDLNHSYQAKWIQQR